MKDINILFRNIKLYMLSESSIDIPKEHIELYELLNKHFENLNCYIRKDYISGDLDKNSLYYGKNIGNIILEIYPIEQMAWIDMNIFQEIEDQLIKIGIKSYRILDSFFEHYISNITNCIIDMVLVDEGISLLEEGEEKLMIK